jgi:DNA-binding transcriptional ArsR family regulator
LVTTKERARGIEESVSYGVGHRIRIEVLCLLNEATYSASELARRTNCPLTTITHHIKELLNAGCIELARTEKVRNADQHFYRAITMPMISDEEARVLPAEVKQEYAAAILQGAMAEGLDALWAGKLSTDPNVRMMWRWFTLDAEGRQELADEQRESWERIMEIEARSTHRRIKSGEEAKTMIAVTLGFERNRPVGASVPDTYRFSPTEGKAE